MRFLIPFAILLLIGRESYGQQPQSLRMAEIQVRLVKAKPEHLRDAFISPGQPPSEPAAQLPTNGFLAVSAVLTNEQMRKSLEQLNKAGGKVITFPKLITLSGRKGRIENVRNIPSPSEYEAQDANNKTVPTAFSNEPDGFIMEFQPDIEDGVIDLEFSLKLKKLNEFIEYPPSAPASNAVWQPSFVTSEVNSSAVVSSGQTLVCAPIAFQTESEYTYILISVHEIPVK